MHQRSRLQAARAVGLVALWSALAAALVELGLTTGTRHLRDGLTFYGADQWWLVPLSFVAYFMVLALPVAGAALIWPSRIAVAPVAGVFAGLGLISVLLARPAIALIASVVLALGCGVQVFRWVSADPARAQRHMRRLSLLVVGLAMAAGIGQRAKDGLGMRRALERLPASSPGAPNVLLLILDTVRASNLSVYGYGRPTSPNLTTLANEGVAFDWAMSTAPWTLPSHATMFTGHYGPSLSTDWTRRLDDVHPTLAEVLSSRGYRTAAFVANRNYAGRGTGLARGFAEYHDTQLDAKQVLLSSPVGQIAGIRAVLRTAATGDWTGAWRSLGDFSLYVDPDPAFSRTTGRDLTDRFLAWEDNASAKPWFAFLNYYDAHEPYLPEAAEAAAFSGTDAMRDAYDASLATVDAQVGRLLQTLRHRGHLDNTIVVVTSDHGELLNQHGLRWHSFMMYIDVLRVPLIMRYPGRVPAGQRVEVPVSLRDLSATILDLAGSVPREWPGTPLAGHWNGNTASTSPAASHVTRAPGIEAFWPASKGPLASLLEGSWHYMRNGDDTEELYNLSLDPAESRNVAGLSTDRERVTGMRRVVDSLEASRK